MPSKAINRLNTIYRSKKIIQCAVDLNTPNVKSQSSNTAMRTVSSLAIRFDSSGLLR